MGFYVTIKKNKGRSICFNMNRLSRDGKKGAKLYNMPSFVDKKEHEYICIYMFVCA